MRLQILFGLLTIASSLGATVLNFDDLTDSGALPANYGGVSWNAGWTHYDTPQGGYPAFSEATRIYNLGALTFSLLSPGTIDGAYFAGLTPNSAGIDTVQWSLYSNNVLVHTSGSISLSDTPTYLATGYSGTVDTALLIAPPGYFVMDDLSFNSTSPVPEPTSAALFALGTAALAYAAQRKRA